MALLQVATFNESPRIPEVSSVIIDGLDGSGKGEITDRLFKRLSEQGYDPIVLDFPRYQLDTGKLIREELKDPKLNIIQRLELYALNRLEGFLELTNLVSESVKQGKKPFIIFDRFTSSNLISIAYELSKTSPELLERTPEELVNMKLTVGEIEMTLRQIFEMIVNLENDFLSLLNLEEKYTVVIPEISTDVTINRMDTDVTRGDGTNNRDKYEQKPVQELSAKIYRAVGLLHPGNFIFVDQRDRTPDEIADDILSRISINAEANIEQIQRILSVDLLELNDTIQKWKAKFL